MATKKAASKSKVRPAEKDSAYLLKLVLYMIVGAQWLRLTYNGHLIVVPLGLLAGLGFALHDHFQIDRKIEFAVLLVACLVGFTTQIGLVMTYFS